MAEVADQGHYVSHMQCYVYRISYDFISRCGEVWMPAGSCTDMKGAIEWFGDIDDGVKAIMTWSEGLPDTSYIRDDAGNWRAQ